MVKRAKEEKSREGGIAASWKWGRGLELQIRRLERSPPKRDVHARTRRR